MIMLMKQINKNEREKSKGKGRENNSKPTQHTSLHHFMTSPPPTKLSSISLALPIPVTTDVVPTTFPHATPGLSMGGRICFFFLFIIFDECIALALLKPFNLHI